MVFNWPWQQCKVCTATHRPEMLPGTVHWATCMRAGTSTWLVMACSPSTACMQLLHPAHLPEVKGTVSTQAIPPPLYATSTAVHSAGVLSSQCTHHSGRLSRQSSTRAVPEQYSIQGVLDSQYMYHNSQLSTRISAVQCAGGAQLAVHVPGGAPGLPAAQCPVRPGLPQVPAGRLLPLGGAWAGQCADFDERGCQQARFLG